MGLLGLSWLSRLTCISNPFITSNSRAAMSYCTAAKYTVYCSVETLTHLPQNDILLSKKWECSLTCVSDLVNNEAALDTNAFDMNEVPWNCLTHQKRPYRASRWPTSYDLPSPNPTKHSEQSWPSLSIICMQEIKAKQDTRTWQGVAHAAIFLVGN